jgi:hypothetical protein
MAALAWIVAVAVLLGYEWYAVATGRKTLSRQMVDWTRAWPLLPVVFGAVAGGLAVHFFWPWCP